MTADRIERAAALLTEARRRHRTMACLPPDARPADEAEGYAVQEALGAALGLVPAAWKVACTSREAQARLATRSPFGGPLPAAALYASPAEIPAERHFMRMVEGEFAFTLARDLPAREAPYARAEVEAALGTLHPAIEVADSRYDDWLAADKPSLIADLAASGALVVGDPVADWRRLDLARATVRMTVNGEAVGEGPGSEALGHPVEAVRWLANHLSARGHGLAAGQLVTTGTCTGNHMARPGDEAVATFAGLGEARVRFP